jgi:RNA polymerase sigma-70 factor (ECF subfamily)
MDSAHGNRMQNLNTYLGLDDAELVASCQKGDESAFGELARRHHGLAMKVAISLLRDRHAAEDEVQNAFLKAFLNLGKFQGEAKFSTWLTRIVVNQCLMRLRQARRENSVHAEELCAAADGLAVQFSDTRATIEQQLGQEEVARLLHHEIRRTPALLRTAFLLRDVEQRPMPEVAEKLGISVAAAKSRLLRARVELRNRLAKHCGRTGAAALMT